jgi:hypothetical protein
LPNPIYEIPDGMVSYTPSDGTDCPAGTVGFYLEGAGSVSVQFRDGSTHVYSNLLIGSEKWGKFKRILATGTTVSAGNLYIMKSGLLKG